MAAPSNVLVVEPENRRDPGIEKALRGPGVEVHTVSDVDEALRLARVLLPPVVIVDPNVPSLAVWRLIARIWERANTQVVRPTFILLADQAGQWDVERFGPVRFSDRQHLPEALRRILSAPLPGAARPFDAEARWEAARDAVVSRGNERFKAEQDRMRGLGILDERGQPASKDWPADMKPESTTDVAT